MSIMLKYFFKKVFGSKNEREINRCFEIVKKINEIELSYQSLTDDELTQKTNEFKKRFQEGETLELLLPEAFATVKNACRRLVGKSWDVCEHKTVWNMIPFDVQLVGGMILFEGRIAEMATGEGKTLVATLPVYLNAIKGPVHVVTVNDYLAKRDSEWMGKVYEFLGLSVGCLQNPMNHQQRKPIYASDIVYGTTSEFGFDYLRDNSMAFSKDEQVQRELNYAIIDEVDSVLIDEARTPLIISGPSQVSSDKFKYDRLKPLVQDLFQKQTYLCNRFLKEGKELFAQDDNDKKYEASLKFYQVKRGMPKNKQLMKLNEEPEYRRLIEKIDLEMISDLRRKERFALCEELYFVIDEKGSEIELTEIGRNLISPDNPEDFIVIDLITAFQEIDEDEDLSEEEKEKAKDKLQLESNERNETLHILSQLLRAYALFEKNVEYVVQDNKVMIVDEFTGRIMPGRRYSDGLHQALEAKEGVQIEKETQTYATITLQNYFRMYDKISGMTGTAETEAEEFFQIYKLQVTVIPTNKPIQRNDENDKIFKTKREKYRAILDDVQKLHNEKLPVLIGTISVETSELLSKYLKRQNIPHNVLNAKQHQSEAEVIARAGKPGAVTIATNMAGRGTDIKLGEGVIRSATEGGLQVIGTERHESRRIDRQLRGRSGRQGDPGRSLFYISLEDDLMRLFGSDRISSIMEKMGLKEGEELAHPLLNRSIETAQKRVEQRNFGIRKHLLQFDDVMNQQRKIIYQLRNEVMRTDDLKSFVFESIQNYIQREIESYLPDSTDSDDWDFPGFLNHIEHGLHVRLSDEIHQTEVIQKDLLLEQIMESIDRVYEAKKTFEGENNMQLLSRNVFLTVIDRLWKDHLYGMDSLREGVGLRAYAQKDPLIEYKTEGFDMFKEMMDDLDSEISRMIFTVTSAPQFFESMIKKAKGPQTQNLIHEDLAGFSDIAQALQNQEKGIQHQTQRSSSPEQSHQKPAPYRRQDPKIGPNEKCPCGSGKKYKKCCGAISV